MALPGIQMSCGTQGKLLVSLLTIPLLAMATPAITFWGVHPASVLLFAYYGFGLRLLADVEDQPMWSPVETKHTQDEAEQAVATGRDERVRRAHRGRRLHGRRGGVRPGRADPAGAVRGGHGVRSDRHADRAQLIPRLTVLL